MQENVKKQLRKRNVYMEKKRLWSVGLENQKVLFSRNILQKLHKKLHEKLDTMKAVIRWPPGGLQISITRGPPITWFHNNSRVSEMKFV